jgi:hypothetical protein
MKTEYTLILFRDGSSILCSDERLVHPNKGWTFIDNQIVEDCIGARKIIAGIPSLPSISISDEVRQKLEELYGWVDVAIDLTRLCYYDKRNPDNCLDLSDLTEEELSIPQIKGVDYANHLCSCDNCFYGRSELTEQLIKHQELKGFSLRDMEKAMRLYHERTFKTMTDVIQHLQQPIEIKVELEMDTEWKTDKFGDINVSWIPMFKLKITDNSVTITKII